MTVSHRPEFHSHQSLSAQNTDLINTNMKSGRSFFFCYCSFPFIIPFFVVPFLCLFCFVSFNIVFCCLLFLTFHHFLSFFLCGLVSSTFFLFVLSCHFAFCTFFCVFVCYLFVVLIVDPFIGRNQCLALSLTQ